MLGEAFRDRDARIVVVGEGPKAGLGARPGGGEPGQPEHREEPPGIPALPMGSLADRGQTRGRARRGPARGGRLGRVCRHFLRHWGPIASQCVVARRCAMLAELRAKRHPWGPLARVWVRGPSMAAFVLPFEKPVVDLVDRVRQLRELAASDAKFEPELRRLEEKAGRLAREIFADLTPMQKVMISRHPNRPYTLDYVQRLFTDWIELHGDRRFADDASIVSGLARFHGRSVVVVG